MPLKKKELDELKALLVEKREHIVEHLYKLKSASESEITDVSGDSADIASLEISQNSYSKLGGRERKLLKKIDLALSKIEEGTYGICELTGEEIPVARLRARPEAQYTVEAKEELERRERGYRSRDEYGDAEWDMDDEEAD